MLCFGWDRYIGVEDVYVWRELDRVFCEGLKGGSDGGWLFLGFD